MIWRRTFTTRCSKTTSGECLHLLLINFFTSSPCHLTPLSPSTLSSTSQIFSFSGISFHDSNHFRVKSRFTGPAFYEEPSTTRFSRIQMNTVQMDNNSEALHLISMLFQ